MSGLERALLGLHAGAWLSLLAVAVLSLIEGPALPLLSREVAGGRWVFLCGWLLLGTVVAVLPTARRAWQLSAVLTAVGLLAFAVFGGDDAGVAMPLSLSALAGGMLMAAWQLQRGQLRKTRPVRRRAKTPSAPPTPRPAWALLAWSAAMVALVASFIVAWQGADADLRGRGAVLLLVSGCAVIPAVSLAHWKPHAALAVLTVCLLVGVTQFSTDSTSLMASLAALAASVVAVGLHVMAPRRC